MQRFKQIIIFVYAILFCMSIYAYTNQATSTVQVTLVPNNTTLSQGKKLFMDSDTQHLEQYHNEDPSFQIGNSS
jgi:hypothetical protein